MKDRFKYYGNLLAITGLGLLTLTSTDVMAITQPVDTSFAYDLYDIGVNKILKGPPGFIGGLFGIVYAASKLSANWVVAVLGILSSTMVLKADKVTTSLGYLTTML